MKLTKRINLLTLILMGLVFISAYLPAVNDVQAATITVTKYSDKPQSDDLVKLYAGAKVLDAKDVKNPSIRFEEVRRKDIRLFYAGVRTRPGPMQMDHNVRTLARSGENGFTQTWGKRLDLKLFNGTVLETRLPAYSAGYYAAIDRDGDKKAETVYLVVVDQKDKKGGFLLGVAVSDDGSAITPLEAFKAGLR